MSQNPEASYGSGPVDGPDAAADTVEIEVEVTRTQIEQTRADMSETLDAIKEKLNPQALMSQARDTVQEVAANVAEQAKSTVQEVAASVAEQARSTVHDVTSDVAEQTRTTVHAVVTDVADHAKDTARGAVTGAVSGAVDEAKEAVGSAVSSAKEAVGNVVDTTRETVGDVVGSARGAGNSLLDMIKRNPWPASLIGLGLGWLYLNSRNQSSGSSTRTRYRGGDYDDYASAAQAAPSYRGPGYSATDYRAGYGEQERSGPSLVEAGRETAGRVVDRVQEKAGQVADTVGSAVHTAREKAGGAVHATADKAGDAVETAKDLGSSVVDLIKRNPLPAAATGLAASWLYMNNRNQSRQSAPVEGWARDYAERSAARRDYDQEDTNGGQGTPVLERARTAVSGLPQSLQKNPMPLAAVALGLGTAVGMLVPETQPENRLMGETRDRLAQKAHQTVDEIKMKAQIVAEEGLDTAKREAKNQGLTTE